VKTSKNSSSSGSKNIDIDETITIEPDLSEHFLAGKIRYAPEELHTYCSPFPSPSDVKCDEVTDLSRDATIEIYYDMPAYKPHECKLKEGVLEAPPELTQADRLAVRRVAFRGKNSVADLALNPGNHTKNYGSIAPKQPYYGGSRNYGNHRYTNPPQNTSNGRAPPPLMMMSQPSSSSYGNVYPPRQAYPPPIGQQYQQQYPAHQYPPHYQQKYQTTRHPQQMYAPPLLQYHQQYPPQHIQQHQTHPPPQQYNPFMNPPPRQPPPHLPPQHYPNQMTGSASTGWGAPSLPPPTVGPPPVPPSTSSNQAALATLRAQLLAAHGRK
jgi:hypothetical protein